VLVGDDDPCEKSRCDYTREYTCKIDIGTGPYARQNRTLECGDDSFSAGCRECTHPGTDPNDPNNTCYHKHRWELALTDPGVPPTDIYPGSEVLVECSTCDDVPLGSDTDPVSNAAAKLTCLDNHSRAGAHPVFLNSDDIQNAIAARMRLLLAFAADRLTGGDYTNILYSVGGLRAHPNAKPVCDVEAGPLPISPECLSYGDGFYPSNFELDWCRSMGMPHAYPAAAGAVPWPNPYCGAFNLNNYPPGACRDEYIEAKANILVDIAGRSFRTIVQGRYDDTLAAALPRLDRIFQHLEWFAAGDAERQRGYTSALVKRFFDAAYAGRYADWERGPFGTNDQQAAKDFTLGVANEGRATDAAIIHAAFSATPGPLRPTLLLGTFTDALHATVEHANLLTEMHDLVCRYEGCGTGDTSPVRDFWRIMAALPDAAALNMAINAATKLQEDTPELVQAFRDIRDHHDRLVAALPVPAPDGTVPAEELPAGGEEILDLVAQARRYLESYDGTGIFVDGGKYQVLTVLPHQENLALNNPLTGGGLVPALATLKEEIDDLWNARITVINNLLQQLQTGQEIDGLDAKVHLMGVRLGDLKSRATALNVQQEADEKAYAESLGGLEDMINSGALSGDELFNAPRVEVPALAGNDSAFDGIHDGAGDTILTVAAPRLGAKWTTELRPREQLRFHITGNWSPTCALRNYELPFFPVEELPPYWSPDIGNATTAETGPEGFSIVIGAQGNNADSSTQTESTGDTACGGGSVYIVESKACWSDSESHQSSSEYTENVSIQFSAGIRLPDTPFPDAPAGSLLVVLTDPSPSTTVRAVQVAYRDSVVVAPPPPAGANPDTFAYSVYLVVNDKNTCEAGPGALTIEATKVTPVGVVAQALGDAMTAILSELETYAIDVILPTGVFPPVDQLARRTLALSQLQQRVGGNFDLNTVPAIRDLFNSWIDMKIASIDRRAQIADMNRNLKELGFEIQAAYTDLKWAGAKAKVLKLIPRSLLRTLDHTALNAFLRTVLDSLGKTIPPLFYIRHPQALPYLRGTSEYLAVADNLRTLGFKDDLEAAARDLRTFGLTVRDVLSAPPGDRIETRKVILAYPRPVLCTRAPPLGCTINPLGRWEWQTFRVPSLEAINAVWTSLKDSRTATFSISPEDIYESVADTARLSCGDHAPVIRRMLLIADTSFGEQGPGPDWCQNGRSANLSGLIENRYPTATGELVYRHVPNSVDFLLPLASVTEPRYFEEFAYDCLDDPDNQVGSGMSPANDFTIGLTSMEDFEFDGTEALFLVMEIETQTTATPVVIPGVCEPQP